MSNEVQLALIASIAPTLMALAAFIQGIRNGNAALLAAAKAEIANTVSSTKQTEIHMAVNGNLAEVKSNLAASVSAVSELRTQVAQLVAAASVPAVPVVPIPVPVTIVRTDPKA